MPFIPDENKSTTSAIYLQKQMSGWREAELLYLIYNV